MALGDIPLRISTRPSFVALVERLVRKSAISQGRSTGSAMALTFDAGPHPEWTPCVLDALQRTSAKGTLFVVGRSAERHREIVRDARRRGHGTGPRVYSRGRRTGF